MNGNLNIQKINYVIDHLGLYYEIPKQILDKFKFIDNNNSLEKGYIYFKLSDKDLDLNKIKYYNNIPILYPNNLQEEVYSHNKEYLIFKDDLIKSAFYFLSGYQEYNRKSSDNLGRFNFYDSIQYKLNITSIPIVNYYFDIIIEAINNFLTETNIYDIIHKKPLFKNFGFLLTHDIDRIKLYSFNNILYKIKEILGLTKSPFTSKKLVVILIKYIYNSLNPFTKDPYWNFASLVELETNSNIKSVWFFLEKNQKHVDSYYHLTNKKVVSLIKYLNSVGHEVGLHGTVQSSGDKEHFLMLKKLLSNVSKKKIAGIRQHRLIYNLPQTADIHSFNNMDYDSSLGFAAHEGFRNSFCLPFRLYNFSEEKAYSTWEFPLNVMDNTLLSYRNLSFEESRKKIFDIILEIKKFNGLFTLLWHNHYFDEELFPGITDFYINLLKDITALLPENYLGYQIINLLNNRK